MPGKDLIWEVGISEQTLFRRNSQYMGVHSDRVRELKQPNLLRRNRCCGSKHLIYQPHCED